jgi:hypothetical protein
MAQQSVVFIELPVGPADWYSINQEIRVIRYNQVNLSLVKHVSNLLISFMWSCESYKSLLELLAKEFVYLVNHLLWNGKGTF